MALPSILHCADETETVSVGTKLAAVLPEISIVGLIGPLGAGKTRLVQAIARAAGVPDGVVASPTFVLVHEYNGRVPIFHFDAYRLRDEDDFTALGPEEYFSRPGWSFVEWADRVSACLPSDHLEISMEPTGPHSRNLTLRAFGPVHDKILTQLAAALNSNRLSPDGTLKCDVEE